MTNDEFINKYKSLYEKNPKSKTFAPLAEAYRKKGYLDKAYKLCINGLKNYPNFAGGRITLARILYDQNKLKEALHHLNKAVELSPENILAYKLLADIHLKLKNPKEALKSFKILLFYNPKDEKTINAVNKLESLTADEYSDEVFIIEPISTFNQNDDFLSNKIKKEEIPKKTTAEKIKALERIISLVDAFIVRNHFEKALERINSAIKIFGNQPELTQRLEMLKEENVLDASQTSQEQEKYILNSFEEKKESAQTLEKNESLNFNFNKDINNSKYEDENEKFEYEEFEYEEYATDFKKELNNKEINNLNINNLDDLDDFEKPKNAEKIKQKNKLESILKTINKIKEANI